jgi:cytochrome c2
LTQINSSDGGAGIVQMFIGHRRPTMPRIRLIHIVLAVVLGLVAIFLIRLHGAAGQPIAVRGDAESGRLYAQYWCTECHSVERETAGTGQFAPDFTVIARRRSAVWLRRFLRQNHLRMPDFVFKPDESADIIAYIVSLKR